MSDRPILFSGSMVRAILAGKKTQTRRLVTPDTSDVSRAYWPRLDFAHAWADPGLGGGAYLKAPIIGGDDSFDRVRCRWQVGDRLWVRETWRTDTVGDGVNGVRFRADDAFVPIDPTREAADAWVDAHENGKHGVSWRPSIFIKRWASRLTLAVESVRVERLGAITDHDAIAEGVETLGKVTDPRGAFVALWESINGERAPWESNPWGWVVTFSRVTP